MQILPKEEIVVSCMFKSMIKCYSQLQLFTTSVVCTMFLKLL